MFSVLEIRNSSYEIMKNTPIYPYSKNKLKKKLKKLKNKEKKNSASSRVVGN